MNSTQEPNTTEQQKSAAKSGTTAADERLFELADAGEMDVLLGWRTWLVVFISAFLTLFMQIFTTVAAPSVIAFIVQDIGDQAMSAWVLQTPLLIQAVLNPIIGRLSDVLDRKMLVTLTPIVAFAGSVMSARAHDMNLLIAGGVLYGVTLATIGVVGTIPAEILPLKYRTLASGIGFVGGASGGLVAGLAAGAFCRTPGGWRNMFWVQAALQLLVSASFFIFYSPPKVDREIPRMRITEIIWACDPVGSCLYIGGATCCLMALNWASGLYSWSNPHVVAPLTIGIVCLLLCGVYEWKGRADGLLAHVFFERGLNFPLALFITMVEGWIYYSAVNTIMNQMTFYLGWETDSLIIGVRQLVYSGPTIIASIVIIWYSTRYKDLKWPLVICFTLFLATAGAFAAMKRDWNYVSLGISAIAGVGQAGPLILLIAVVQYAAPHAFLSTATGLAFSIRAIGGAFGSAVLYTIVFGHVKSHYGTAVAKASIAAGLSPEEVPILLCVMAGGNGPPTEALLARVLSQALPSATLPIIRASRTAGQVVYARGFQLAWASTVPMIVVSLVCCALLQGVERLMTDKVESPLEKTQRDLEVKITTSAEAEH
ncbi:hypothetical protein PV08_05137 [Exophiala spinifera]|uniref:Major facilitator superfamily (MFS) profile domain-containing protein n=1 Tax=Exophiala spinifera TaxID=91928 RepID=A0A0D1ZZ55_9EURO|nr:uncharacterized protein PV08_05137 [Exophiala spinifera]KIW17942.1 hypothetical protein PV08_05137 [Exophiala spinifera]